MSFWHSSDPLKDEDLSAVEIRQIWRRRFYRRLLTLGVPALFILIIITALAIPRVKDWRARQFAEQANTLRLQGKLQEAFNNAATAIQMRPTLADSQRAYAAVLVAAGKAEGIPVLQQLIDEGKATAQDRLNLAEAGLHFADLALAEREATWLLDQKEKAAEAFLVLARVRLAQNRSADAEHILKQCLDVGGSDNAVILLAQLKFAANASEAAKEAVSLLQPLTTKKGAMGLAALMVLLNSPAISLPEAASWVKAAHAHPLINDEQKLALASAEIQVTPAASSDILHRMIEEFRSGTPAQRVLLGRWLNHNHQYAETLKVISPEEAMSHRDLFLIRLDAMAGLGDWTGISTLLDEPNLPLQTPFAMLYRGRAAREVGDSATAATYYRRALRDPTLSPEVLWYVVGYLNRIGEHQVLEQELNNMTSNPTLARKAFEALVPLVQARQDAEEMYKLYERMILILPSDYAAQNDLRYFAALTKHRIDTTGAQELVKAEPRMLAYRITLALTLLREGKNAEALHVFDGETLNPADIQPYQRAILAAILGANGRESEAQDLATNIPGDSITTQEMELIKPWHKDPASPKPHR